MNKIIVSSIAFTMLVGLFGCSQVSKQVKLSSISSDISGLVQDKDAEPSLVFIRPGAPTLADYERFIIDPIAIDYNDPAMKDISEKEILEMQHYFYSAMKKELTNAGYKVVTRSGSGTLRLTFTISGLKAPTAATNVSILLVPGMSTAVGEVTIEAVFKDSSSNQINAVVRESSRGSYMFNSNPISTWSDVEIAFDNWATGFREAVDKAHKK